MNLDEQDILQNLELNEVELQNLGLKSASRSALGGISVAGKTGFMNLDE